MNPQTPFILSSTLGGEDGGGDHRHFVENSSLNAPIRLEFIWKNILHQNLQQTMLFFSNSDQYALPPLLAHSLPATCAFSSELPKGIRSHRQPQAFALADSLAAFTLSSDDYMVSSLTSFPSFR